MHRFLTRKSVARDLASLAAEGSLFADSAAEKLQRLQAELLPLAARYDVVVANPPYMGSSNMNNWLSSWVKDTYPDSKRDLCTCFIEHGFELLSKYGYSAMVTMESWMFLSSFENMRKSILKHHSIRAMVYMNHMVMRIAFNTCATVFGNQYTTAPGLYTKVEYVDLNEQGIPFEFPVKRHAPKQKEGALEALANPDCGWFYRRSAKNFKTIPGMPIAYWASESTLKAFSSMPAFSKYASPMVGLQTGENSRFLRYWWEPGREKCLFECENSEMSVTTGKRWFAHSKGGEFRKWYGNNDYVVNWENNGWELKHFDGAVIRNPEYYFRDGITYSDVSSGRFHARYSSHGSTFNVCGPTVITDDKHISHFAALVNSSAFHVFLDLTCPTLHYNNGVISTLPVPTRELFDSYDKKSNICARSEQCRNISKHDWDSFETSWDFKRHPLI